MLGEFVAVVKGWGGDAYRLTVGFATHDWSCDPSAHFPKCAQIFSIASDGRVV